MTAPAYLPLFGSDYLADTRHLTTEEHGAYLLLMMAAWRQHDCGLPSDDKKLARIVGLSARKWDAIKGTILEFWTVENGRIFQSRLRKEHSFVLQKSESNRKSANARWDKQDTENNKSYECERISKRTSVRNAPQPQTHKEEEIPPNGGGKTDVSPPPPDEPENPDQITQAEVVEGWNVLANRHGLPTISKLTDSRKRKLLLQRKRFTVPEWVNVWAKIEQSPFLRGSNDRGWRCDFDFVLSEANFTKILEGKYDAQQTDRRRIRIAN